MTKQEDEIRLKDLLDIYSKEEYKEIIEILNRDQKRHHQEQLILSYKVSHIKNTIIKHYRKFFDLHAKGIALNEDDQLNIDWAEDLVKNCFTPNVVRQKELLIDTSKVIKSSPIMKKW
jgi:hypothetical protein